MSGENLSSNMNAAPSQLIVGVGASAGGVEALGHFFDGMPSACGLAFVVVTHTAPHQKMRLHEILARHTPMTVATATDGELIAPDHVYVLPADSILTLAGHRLVLRPIDPRQRPRNLIDVFFSSLALEARENAIGVVLSGTGTDGTLGIKVIKEHGGLTVAQGQNGSGPQYDGMPMSAIAGGMVDVVLPVERMGARLQEYVRHVAALRSAGFDKDEQPPEDSFAAAIEDICATTTLEELKSGNEELVSVNEELQSTNEELETSREELQSINEELHTVNNELADKVEELHRANADLSNLFEGTQVATVFLDRHLIIRSYTPAITAIFNLIPSDRGRPLADIAHQIEDVDLRKDIRQVLDGRPSLERPIRLRDRNVFHLMRVLPYRTAADEVDGVLVTFVNVTAVVVAEEQQRLLVAELNHRVRNMLQVVIGLANQTLHRSADLQVFEKSFMGRMQALARAYQLLSHDGWHNVPLEDLLRSQLSPFAAEERYSTSGENVILTANAALALGLIFYELGTNATKYGALSVAQGHVDVCWKMEGASNGTEHEFVLHWIERDGPVVMPPTRHGFGSELVQRQLRYELNGNVAMDFAASGLKVRLVIPSNQIVQGKDRPAPAAPVQVAGNAANG